MTEKTFGPDGKKMPGWFSWRHRTTAANAEARNAYQANRGTAARQERAAARLAGYPLCERHGIRTPACKKCEPGQL